MNCDKGLCVYGKVGIVLLVVILNSRVHTTFTCPKDCFCPPHSKNVQCANKNLERIPEGIPTETLELNLNENTFKDGDLTRRNFTELVNIESLFLIDCGIETISVDTFSDLKHLSWLDLSKNNIRYIADYTFRGLHLQHLFLNDNIDLHLSIGAFAGMTTRGLYMQNCGLRKLPVDLMNPLNGSLKTIWLDGNHFEAFSEKWLYFFQGLAHIRLGGNSFHCNCEIRWFYKFFKKSRTSLFAGRAQPQCASPNLVKGKEFDDLTEENFQCELPTFSNVDAVFDNKMGKFTCKANGDPAPTLYWIRPDGTTESYYPRDDDEGRENMGVLFMTELKLDSKENYKCVASNPAGNVTFSLNVVWPDMRPDLPPTPKPTQPPPAKDNNVIRVDDSSTPKNRMYKNYAGDDSGVYDWSNINSESSKMSHPDRPAIHLSKDSDKKFSIVDIVGAVVGTFILTLLISVTLFHFYYRRRERLTQDDHHYSVPDEVNTKISPRSPHNVFIMNEPDENRIKMINHHNGLECPS